MKVMDTCLFLIYINEVEGDGHTVVRFLVLLVGDRLTAHV